MFKPTNRYYIHKCIQYLNKKKPYNEIPPFPPVLYRTYPDCKTDYIKDISTKKRLHKELLNEKFGIQYEYAGYVKILDICFR